MNNDTNITITREHFEALVVAASAAWSLTSAVKANAPYIPEHNRGLLMAEAARTLEKIAAAGLPV